MWELDSEEGWAPKNWCFWTVVLEKTLESPLDCKEIQPVHSEGDQPWDFFGRNDPKAETPVLWPPHAKCWLIGKDSDAGRDWGQEEKGTTKDEMAGWHHRLDGRECEWTPGDGDDREAWLAAIHWIAKSWTRLSDWTELNCAELNPLRKSTDVSVSELWELVMDREAWRAAIHGVPKSWTRLSDWIELNYSVENFTLFLFVSIYLMLPSVYL